MAVAEKTIEDRRTETWITIHRAASSLTMQEGLAGATIDAIAARAGISRRTFFNYFAAKEDAVLGLRPPEVPQNALAEFMRTDRDLLTSLAHFMIAVAQTSYTLAPDPKIRRQLTKRYPELRERRHHYAEAAEALIAPLLRDRLSISEVPAVGDSDRAADAMLSLARCIVQFAYSSAPNAMKITRADIDADIALFRSIMKETL